MRIRAWIAIPIAIMGLASPLAAQTVSSTVERLRPVGGQQLLLERRAGLNIEDATLAAALPRLSDSSGVPLAFSPTLVAAERARVRCECQDLTVGEALNVLLRRTAFQYRELHGEVLVYRDPGSSREPLYPLEITPRRGVLVAIPGIVTRRAPHAARQTGTIVGRVSDASTGQPLAGAHIRIQDSRRSAITNNEGGYRLDDLPPGVHIVAASMIGYRSSSRSVTLAAGESLAVEFELEISPVRLDQVVVTATGDQRRAEIGHVVGTIRADSVAQLAPVTRLTDIINARIPGVQVLANTGLTGEGPRVRIRGTNSFNVNRDPLLYVDGVRVENSTGLDWAPYGRLPGRFNDINPNDIESVEVVKGPTAATLYGTGAANGVILIRTKRGRPGRAQWTTYFETGGLEPAQSFDGTDSYYSWGTNLATGAAMRCLLVQQASGVCGQDSLTVYNPLTDPNATPIGRGTRNQIGMQVTGGVSQLTYLLALDRETEEGYLRMPPNDLERLRTERGGAVIPEWQLRPNALDRWSGRASLSADIGEHADVRVSSSLISARTLIPGNDVFTAGFWGSGHPSINGGWLSATRPGEIFAMRSAEDLTRSTTSVSANWRPLSWLSTRATAGADLSSSMFDALQRPDEGPPGGRIGQRLNRRVQADLYTVDLGSSASFQILPAVTSRTSVGAQYNRTRHRITAASATGLPPGAETVTGAATTSGQESHLESVVAGAYVEQVFGINDRLFLTAAVRGDGGSSFGSDFSTAMYPKASVSWVATEEPFFPAIPFVDALRLRFAYGQSGVQPGSTDALALVTRFSAIVDGSGQTGARLSRLGNPDLKPERQSEYEVGLDLEVIGGRVSLEATHYNRLSTDALMTAPSAPSVGVGTGWINVGSVRNWGWEGLLNVRVLELPRAALDVTLNGSINHNRLEKLAEGVTSLGSAQLGMHREGFPLFGRWGRPILGWEDANGNGIIEPTEVVVGDTLEYIGPSVPPKQLTAASVLTLFDGRFRVSTQFDYRGRFTVFHGAAVNHCTFQSCRAVNDPTAPLDLQARDVVARQFGAAGWTGYMENVYFVRWRELAATYQLPRSLAERIGASSLSITASGRNLHLWTDFTGIDPESNAQTSLPQFSDGYIGNPTAPQTRYLLLRANVSF